MLLPFAANCDEVSPQNTLNTKLYIHGAVKTVSSYFHSFFKLDYYILDKVYLDRVWSIRLVVLVMEELCCNFSQLTTSTLFVTFLVMFQKRNSDSASRELQPGETAVQLPEEYRVRTLEGPLQRVRAHDP